MSLFHAGWWSYLRYDETQDRPHITWPLVRRVAAYGRPYLRGIAAMLATIVAITLLNLAPPLLARNLIDVALPQRDFVRLNWLALGMIIIPLLTGLLSVLQRYLSASIGEGVIYDLRVALFSHLQRMSLRFFTHTKTGELISRLNNDVIGAQRAIAVTLVDLVTNLVALLSTLAVMVRLEWRLTALAIVVLPLFIIPVRILGKRLRAVVREQMMVSAEMNAMMNETLNVSGALLVKLFGQSENEARRFGKRAGLVREAGIKQAFLMRWFTATMSLVTAAGTAAIFWGGGLMVLSDPNFTVGTIVAFISYISMLYGPLAALSNAPVEFATSMVSFERVFEVLDLPVEIKESPQARRLEQVEGHVCFDHVSFSYQPGENAPGSEAVALSEVVRYGRQAVELPPLSQERGRLADGHSNASHSKAATVGEDEVRWALRDVSFEVRPGQLVALVGPSGAGKTTITYLLPRLYDPTEGAVRIDGHDIRDLTLDTLVEHIGMVTQEPYLFNDTIRANLLYARPDATPAEIEAACRAANIHDFIMELPDGYETVVGNRGFRLSGGEKQRLAIARVILKNPRILVLDEATSSLDSHSEALIQEALERIMAGRTSLVIAHRLSTILAANLILVLDHGRLVEQGTHSELLAKGGLYAELYETQFRHAR